MINLDRFCRLQDTVFTFSKVFKVFSSHGYTDGEQITSASAFVNFVWLARSHRQFGEIKGRILSRFWSSYLWFLAKTRVRILPLIAVTFRLSLSHDDTPIRPWNGDIHPYNSPCDKLERSSDRWKRIKLLDQRIVQKTQF